MTRAHVRLWGWSLTAAVLLTVLSTTQDYASRLIEGLPANWSRLVRLPALDWFAWALLAPLVFMLGPAMSRSRSGRWVTTGWWILSGIGFLVAHSLIEVIAARALGWVPNRMPFWTMFPARFAGTLASSLVVFCGLVLASNAVRQYTEDRAREQREAALRAQLAQSRLHELQTQLHPHFFFNTLHTVSALMSEDVGAARRVLADLGDLLRESLARVDAHELALAEELAFLGKYLDIERIRFRDRLQVVIEADPAVADALVPSLVLQPLVENALRHAIAPRAGPGKIWVRTFREGGSTHLEVEDDGPGLPEPTPAPKGSGVGIANTRARLAQLYGTDAAMTMSRGAAGGLLVHITLPYHSTSGGRPG